MQLQLEHYVSQAVRLFACAVELKHCSQLRRVSLEANRLTTPVIDLRAYQQLKSLNLFGNPLDFLPELSPCTSLRHLSLANVRISADEAFSQWDVEVVPIGSYISRSHKLAPFFALIFRRTTGQHPLLAGALGATAKLTLRHILCTSAASLCFPVTTMMRCAVRPSKCVYF